MSRQRSSGDLLADRRYAYAEACLAEEDFTGAAEMALQALDLAPRYAPAWFLLGQARDALGSEHRSAARHAFETVRALDPDDALGAGIHLARLGGDTAGAITPSYIRALFDGYAPRFERHLVDALGYRGPGLIVEALDGLADAPRRFEAALDLGCGTGLMGAALGERVGHLAGCDLSPAMLALARRGGHYARLAEADLVGFLNAEPPASADLVVAADVFIYLGDLAPALAGIARALRPGGYAALTVQSPEPAVAEPVTLGPDGRYAHADRYLVATAASCALRIVALHPSAIRRERHTDVAGRILILNKGPITLA